MLNLAGYYRFNHLSPILWVIWILHRLYLTGGLRWSSSIEPPVLYCAGAAKISGGDFGCWIVLYIL